MGGKCLFNKKKHEKQKMMKPAESHVEIQWICNIRIRFLFGVKSPPPSPPHGPPQVPPSPSSLRRSWVPATVDDLHFRGVGAPAAVLWNQNPLPSPLDLPVLSAVAAPARGNIWSIWNIPLNLL